MVTVVVLYNVWCFIVYVLLQEIANLAARILKITMAGDFYTNKRNAGTVDSLFNLPDLLGVGRRYINYNITFSVMSLFNRSTIYGLYHKNMYIVFVDVRLTFD